MVPRGTAAVLSVCLMQRVYPSFCPREQPETPKTWIGSGESTSEKRGWGSCGGQPREHWPLAHPPEPLPTVSAMSQSPWPPPPPPESSSLVSGMGELPPFIDQVLEPG